MCMLRDGQNKEDIFGTATRANGVCVIVMLFSCESYVYIHTLSCIK